MNSIYFEPPDHWTRTPIKALVDGPDNGAWGDEPGLGDIDVVCARVADFEWEHLTVNLSNPTIRSIKRNQFNRLALRNGDLLIEKSGGGEKTPVGRVVAFSGDVDAITSNFVARMRPKPGFSPDFLKYLFAAHYLSGFTYQFIKQATGIQNLDDKPLMQVVAWVPDPENQDTIARFLDCETGLIDGLIEKKTRFIALLKEKRAAVITHAVTKGIDRDAPMKDSGQDWLGRVPVHWDVVPATALFTVSGERAREGDQMLSATQKYGVIPLAEYEALEQRQVTMAVVNLDMRKHVELGDFVISMRSMDGGLERARAVGSVRSSYSVLKPGPDVEGRFYGALMKSSLYIQALRLTSNFIRDGQDLNFGHVRKVKLPKPDLREQAAIADHIEAETTRIDGLITLTERSIELLREKRSALITAAVTGKIDVRAAA